MTSRKFTVTTWLIIANVVVFLSGLVLFAINPQWENYFVLTPASVFQGQYLWSFLTSMFMHANFSHIIFNMISLFYLGRFAEKLVGRKRFFWFYIIAGLFAGLVFASLAYFFGYGFWESIFGNPAVAGVGASGAIFGLAGLLTMLVPKSKVYLIAGPLVAIVVDSISSLVLPASVAGIVSILLTIYIFVSIFSIFSFNPRTIRIALPIQMPFWMLPIVAIVPLVIVGIFFPLPIGNMAHFGGLIAGLVYGFYLRKRYKRKTALIRRYFS